MKAPEKETTQHNNKKRNSPSKIESFFFLRPHQTVNRHREVCVIGREPAVLNNLVDESW